MKKNLRALLALVMAAAMLLSLAACGEKTDDPKTVEETPEMVYTADVLTMEKGVLNDGISPSIYTDEGFYGLSYGKLADGVVPEGKTLEYEGQYDVYGYRIFFVSFDGKVRELTGYVPMEPKEDPGDKLDFSSGCSIYGLLLDGEGRLTAVETRYTNWFDGTEDELNDTDDWSRWDKYRNETEYYLRRLDENGAELSCNKLEFEEENSWLDFSRCQLDQDGNLLVLSDMALYAFGPDGSLRYTIESDSWFNNIIKLRDGTIAVAAWNDNGDLSLWPVDLQKRSLGDPTRIPNEAYNPMPGDDRYDFYYMDGMYLYGYDMEAGEKTKLLNWMDCDINGNNLGAISIRKDGTVIGVLNQWKNDAVTTEIITLHQVPYDSVPQKETLTMAVMYTYDILDKVIDFNRHNDNVRIQLVDYSEFNDYENGDYDAGRTKLLTEVMSGNMPDLIALGELPYSQMAAKGLLEDLYPYLDADPEMDRKDFFPNVLQALEVNGGLYQICSSFNIETLIGAASVVGDKPGWNYEQFREALASMPEGCEPMEQYTTRDDLLQSLLFADLDHFVDWSTGKCSFDSEDFMELLKFAADFPAEISDDVEWESSETRIAEGRQMLSRIWLYSVDSTLWNDVQFGESGCTYIGYPTNNGVGSVMSVGSGFGMSANCKNKEAAWEFLRSYLSDDAQQNVYDGIPLSLKAYQEALDQAMTPEYETDEDGKIKLDENGEKIQISRGGYMMEDGTMRSIYAMTQEQADKLWEAVTTCTKVVNFDTSIYDIVNEQAQAFFAGHKSVEEVARLIQSKASIYVNEQR